MRQVFLFSSHSNDSPNLKLFCQKNAQYCSHLCGEAAFAFAERENWLSFRSSLTYPNFQITCVEEQQFVRAWSKGQYVKNTSCSQLSPTKILALFLLRIWPNDNWSIERKKHFWLKISNHSRPSIIICYCQIWKCHTLKKKKLPTQHNYKENKYPNYQF